ncbi:unnamed protein product [Soboliphyme baturini]|uniref:HSF_DOMAIN domain-containing protein n=1 Tax=Soboliphyme baturini TaxID=241478 RepID=A0A183J4E5_9BILA|nr:unnamed protein product [Soboliphyme baturini]
MPHSDAFGDTQTPLFLHKLWKIVNSTDVNYHTTWDEDGFSFIITDTEKFSRDVLPYFFKHGNLNSFVRQLNMYGFRKVSSMERGTLKSIKEVHIQFQHPYFVRDYPDLLFLIRRKISGSGTRFSFGDEATGECRNSALMNRMLTEMQQFKERMTLMEGKMSRLSKENSHKIIQFLLTLAQPEKNVGKRPLLNIAPRMITSSSKENSRKKMRVTGTNDVSELMRSLEQELKHRASGGPIIADVTDEIDSINDGSAAVGQRLDTEKVATCNTGFVEHQEPSVEEACSNFGTFAEFVSTNGSYPAVGLRNIQQLLDQIKNDGETRSSNIAAACDNDSLAKSFGSTRSATPLGDDDFDALHELFTPTGSGGPSCDYDEFNDIFLVDRDLSFPDTPGIGKEISIYQPPRLPVRSARNEQNPNVFSAAPEPNASSKATAGSSSPIPVPESSASAATTNTLFGSLPDENPEIWKQLSFANIKPTDLKVSGSSMAYRFPKDKIEK